MSSKYILLYMFVLAYKPFYHWLKYLVILSIIINIAFFMSAHKDPGYVKQEKQLRFTKLVEKLDPLTLCP